MRDHSLRPITFTALHVDSEGLVDRVVLLRRHSLELQDQFSSHDPPLSRVVVPYDTRESVTHPRRSCLRVFLHLRSVVENGAVKERPQRNDRTGPVPELVVAKDPARRSIRATT